MKIRWLVIIASVAALFTTSTVSAFSVSPLRWQLTVTPGKEQIISVTVTNNEPTTNTFLLAVSGVKQNEKGQPLFGEGYDEAETWVTPQKTSITLVPNEKRKVFVNVKPKITAEPGTHYAAVMVKKKSTQMGAVGIAGQTAVLLEIAIAGVVNEGLSINTWSVEKNLVTKPVWKTVIELQNTGTISLPLSGKMVVNNWRGRQVSEQALSLGNTLIPGTKRTVDPAIAGTSFWPGPYRADIIVVYGRNQTTARATQTIWYVPTWSIGLLLGVIIIVVLALHFKKRPARSYE